MSCGISTFHDGAARRRRGGATAGLLLTLTAMAGMATAAVVVGPRFSNGAFSGSEAHNLSASQDERQIFTNRLAGIFGGSYQVLALHDRGYTPYSEAVLWV